MPADTMNAMIVGFAVILGVLTFYAITLSLRYRSAQKKQRFLRDN
jgi:uncharacterized membrane protein